MLLAAIPLLFSPHFTIVQPSRSYTLTADPHGNAYVIDQNFKVTKIDPDGKVVYSVTPWHGVVGYGVVTIDATTADASENLYFSITHSVLNRGDTTIVKLDSAGRVVYEFDTGGDKFGGAISMAVGPDGGVYVTDIDETFHLDPNGNVIYYSPSAPGISNHLTIDSSGAVYIAGLSNRPNFITTPGAYRTKCNCRGNTYNRFIQKLNPDGSIAYSTFLYDSGVPSQATETYDNFQIVVDQTGYATMFETSGTAKGYSVTLSTLNSAGSQLLNTTSYNSPFPLGPYDGAGNFLSISRGASGLPLSQTDYSTSNVCAVITHASDGEIVYAACFPFADGVNSLSSVDIAPDGKGGFLILTSPLDFVALVLPNIYLWQLTRFVPDVEPHPAILTLSNAVAPYLYGSIAPGELVRLGGVNLGPEEPVQSEPGSHGAFPMNLDGTEVYFNGIRGAIISASNQEVVAVVPFDLAGATSARVEVKFNQRDGSPLNLPLVPFAPSVALRKDTDQNTPYFGSYTAAALNEDGTLNSLTNPAHPGSIVSLFISGGGVLTPTPPNGSIQTFGAVPTVPISAICDSGDGFARSRAEITYAGVAPGQIAGMMQINVRVGTLATGHSQSLGTAILLTFGDDPTPSTGAYIFASP